MPFMMHSLKMQVKFTEIYLSISETSEWNKILMVSPKGSIKCKISICTNEMNVSKANILFPREQNEMVDSVKL